MSLDLRLRLFNELDSLVLIDPHTHINPLDPASHTLADILGYHYYTELAHSAGLPKDQVEDDSLTPREKVRRLIENLGPLDNTIQHSWFVEMAQSLFGFEAEEVTPENWEGLFDASLARMSKADWPRKVLDRSRLEAVFLTNDFDDPLEGFDTSLYIPCLRTDDLVFHLAKPEVRRRLQKATGQAAADAQSLRRAIGELFKHFKSHGARACAISLPPDFAPQRVSAARANTALAAINAEGIQAAESHRRAIGNFVFWTLAEMCADYKLPFDLMIGVNRGVYEAGVHQGRDLYDSRVSLIQYKELFNAFPQVTFPISVLASVTNQELTSYAWIFPNVVTNGHWWYSNTPTFIEHDLAARLEAVPRTKQIGYYSDMYKLEFALPKFAMYKRILAKVLAERFVIDRGWSETKAVELGTQVLRGNVERVFRWDEDLRTEVPAPSIAKTYDINPLAPALAASTAVVQEPAWGDDMLDPDAAAGAGGIGQLQPSGELRIEPQEDDGSFDLYAPEPQESVAAPKEDSTMNGLEASPLEALPAEAESGIELDALDLLGDSKLEPAASGTSVVDLDVPPPLFDSGAFASVTPPATLQPLDPLEEEIVLEAAPAEEETPLAGRQTVPFQQFNLEDLEAEDAEVQPDEPDSPDWDFLKKDK